MLLGQNISSATNLIGAEIDAISDDNQKVTGVVEKVSVANGEPKLHLDLNPRAEASDEEGDIEAGNYEYRVVWTQDNQLFGVDPLATADGEIDGRGRRLGRAAQQPAGDHRGQACVSPRSRRGRLHLSARSTNGKSATFLDTVGERRPVGPGARRHAADARRRREASS